MSVIKAIHSLRAQWITPQQLACSMPGVSPCTLVPFTLSELLQPLINHITYYRLREPSNIKKKEKRERRNNNKLFIFYLQYAIVQQVSSQSTFTRLPQFFMILLYPYKLISFFTRIKLKRINVAPYSRNPEKGRRDSCSVSFFEE